MSRLHGNLGNVYQKLILFRVDVSLPAPVSGGESESDDDVPVLEGGGGRGVPGERDIML